MALTENTLRGDLPVDICSKIPNLEGFFASKNQFSGHTDSRFNNCSKLRILSVSFNNFVGHIPKEIGNLTGLIEFHCGSNQFQGEIPPEFGNLHNLQVFTIIDTPLGGPISPSIWNLSSLSFLSLGLSGFTGSIPHDISLHMPNLQFLALAGNRLTGAIPNSVSNLTKLTNLALAQNQLTGAIPKSLGNLRFLQSLDLFDNFLTADSFSFIESLTRCTSLQRIGIDKNDIDIHLQPSIGNFSTSLTYFIASRNRIRGNIPSQIGNLSGLLALSLGDSLTTVPPSTIQNLLNLQYLSLGENKISGVLPNYMCNMKQLSIIFWGDNNLYGQIPKCFGNLTSLIRLSLYNNRLNFTLPDEIGNLKNLLYLDLYSNFLSGTIPSGIGGLSAAFFIDLSYNNFSGNIPQSIGLLGNLLNISLNHNQLQGQIPETFKNLISIQQLDLSHNNLSGKIPSTLGMLLELNYFNISFNHFQGRVPSNGSFLNFTSDSFMSNDALCGGPPQLNFPLCITDPNEKVSGRKKLHTVAYTLIPIVVLAFLMSVMLFVFLRRQKKVGNLSQAELGSSFERVSYYEIQRATDGFNKSNLLGTGRFGSVYKAVLRDGTILAVKVFNQQLERAIRSFDTECEVISNIRHRNLLKVISSCSNLDFKALVLQYMPNGSLEKWLYSHNHFLDFLQRLNIMIDVASALVYMHHDYSLPIVHCDLKPSNVLLDEEMTGHVSDFGISKLLAGEETMVRTMTLATIGYTAPEYGSEGLVSTKCDVYSFGILLMETFTRKKPCGDIFREGWGLRDMIMDGLQNLETEFIDQNLILVSVEDQKSNKIVKCTLLIMELALKCALDSAEHRADVKDVLSDLQKIKILFLSNSTRTCE